MGSFYLIMFIASHNGIVFETIVVLLLMWFVEKRAPLLSIFLFYVRAFMALMTRAQKLFRLEALEFIALL